MIHYNVWFSFSDGASEADGLGRVRAFLDDLRARGHVHDFTLLRSRAKPGQSRLAPLHAVIVFASQDQFTAAFQAVETSGVHSGRHGLMIEHVGTFIVEIFDEVPAPRGEAGHAV